VATSTAARIGIVQNHLHAVAVAQPSQKGSNFLALHRGHYRADALLLHRVLTFVNDTADAPKLRQVWAYLLAEGLFDATSVQRARLLDRRFLGLRRRK
jgi:hypothetical protein